MSFLVNPFRYAVAGCTDADSAAFLTAAGITDATITSAICTLVTSMKADGTWAKCNAIYPMVGGTATTHKFNLKNPVDSNAAFRLNFVGGWTHSANGALPNGTNAYADTFLTPTTTLSLNSTHLSFYSRTITTGGVRIDMAAKDTSLYLSSQYATNGVITNINILGFAGGIAVANSQGLFISSRTTNTAWGIYRNNLNIANRTSAANTLSANTILLASQTITSGFSSRQQAFTSIGSGLNSTEAAALYTAVQAFQTTLGRQV
jgi:hypothetical protein